MTALSEWIVWLLMAGPGPSSLLPRQVFRLHQLQRLPPPRPRDHRVSKLAGAHVNVAGEPVDEPGLGFGIVVDEVEQRVGTGTPRLRSSAALRAQLARCRVSPAARGRPGMPENFVVYPFRYKDARTGKWVDALP